MEATAKAIGTGLSATLSTPKGFAGAGALADRITIRRDGEQDCKLAVSDLEDYPGFAVAVAAESDSGLFVRTRSFRDTAADVWP